MTHTLRHAMKLAELATETRLLHMLVCGKTGMGKSTLLREIALQDAARGHGLLLVDPHGDLAADVLANLPRRRKNDIVHFDATDPTLCPGLNPLRAVSPKDRALVTSNVISTFRRLFDAGLWGPRTEHLLRHILLALLEVRGTTLADARDMLVDDKRRGVVLRQVKDANVLVFPDLGSANVSYKLLSRLGGAETIGPILLGIGAPVHVLQAGDDVKDIVAMTAVAVMDAQSRG